MVKAVIPWKTTSYFSYAADGDITINLIAYTDSPFTASAPAPVGQRWIAGPVQILVPSVLGSEGYAAAPSFDGTRSVPGAIDAAGTLTENTAGNVLTARRLGGWQNGQTPVLQIIGALTEGAVVYRDFTQSGTVAVTRTSTGTFIDAANLMQTAAINVARFDFSRGSRALLLESAAGNLCPNPNNFSAWTSGAAGTTVSGNKVIATAATGLHGRNFVRGGTTIGVPHTWQLKVAAAEYSKVRLDFTDQSSGDCAVDFDLTAGTRVIVPGGSWTAVNGTIGPWLADGYRLLTITATRNAGTNIVPVIYLLNNAGASSFLGDGTSGILVKDAQLEVGSVATSFTASSRAADSASINLPAGTYDRRIVTADGTVDTLGIVHAGGPIALPMGLIRSIAFFTTAVTLVAGPDIDMISVARAGVSGVNTNTVTYPDIPVAATGETLLAFLVQRGMGSLVSTTGAVLEGTQMVSAGTTDVSGVGLQRVAVRRLPNPGVLTDRTLSSTGLSGSTSSRGTAILVSGSDLDECLVAINDPANGTTAASVIMDVQAGDVLIAILDRTATDFGPITWTGLTELSPSLPMGTVTHYSAVAMTTVTANNPALTLSATWGAGGNNQILAVLRIRKAA